MDPVRRRALASLPFVPAALGEWLSSAYDTPTRPVVDRDSGLKVGRADVERINEARQAFTRMDYAFGSRLVRPAIIDYLTTTVAPLLQGRYDDEVGSQLMIAAAGFTRLAGVTAYDLGLRVRLPIAAHELGFSATYGTHLFEIEDGENGPGGPNENPVPDVDYAFVRLGADFTYNMSSYFLSGNLGFRVISSAGEDPGQIQNVDWYPNSDVGGVDVGLTGGYNINDRLTVTLGLDLRNFFYSMNNVRDDFTNRPVAGGATDMYFAGLLSAQYRLR